MSMDIHGLIQASREYKPNYEKALKALDELITNRNSKSEVHITKKALTDLWEQNSELIKILTELEEAGHHLLSMGQNKSKVAKQEEDIKTFQTLILALPPVENAEEILKDLKFNTVKKEDVLDRLKKQSRKSAASVGIGSIGQPLATSTPRTSYQEQKAANYLPPPQATDSGIDASASQKSNQPNLQSTPSKTNISISHIPGAGTSIIIEPTPQQDDKYATRLRNLAEAGNPTSEEDVHVSSATFDKIREKWPNAQHYQAKPAHLCALLETECHCEPKKLHKSKPLHYFNLKEGDSTNLCAVSSCLLEEAFNRPSFELGAGGDIERTRGLDDKITCLSPRDRLLNIEKTIKEGTRILENQEKKFDDLEQFLESNNRELILLEDIYSKKISSTGDDSSRGTVENTKDTKIQLYQALFEHSNYPSSQEKCNQIVALSHRNESKSLEEHHENESNRKYLRTLQLIVQQQGEEYENKIFQKGREFAEEKNSFEEQRTQLLEENKNLSYTVNQLSIEIENLKAKLANSNDHKKLADKIDLLQKAFKANQSLSLQSETRMKELGIYIETAINKNEDFKELSQKLINAEMQLDIRENTIQNLNERLQFESTENANLKKEKDFMKSDLLDLEEKLTFVENKHCRTKEQLKKVHKVMEDLKNEKDQLLNELKHQKQIRGNLESQIETLKENLMTTLTEQKKIQESLEVVKEAGIRQSAENEHLKSLLKFSEAKCESLTRNCEECQENIRRLREFNEELKEQEKSQMKHYETVLEQTKGNCERLSKTINSTQEELEKERQTRLLYEEKLSIQDVELERLQLDVSISNSDIEFLNKEIIKYKEIVNFYRLELDKANKSCVMMRTEAVNLVENTKLMTRKLLTGAELRVSHTKLDYLIQSDANREADLIQPELTRLSRQTREFC